jgi:hypothetical protein
MVTAHQANSVNRGASTSTGDTSSLPVAMVTAQQVNSTVDWGASASKGGKSSLPVAMVTAPLANSTVN